MSLDFQKKIKTSLIFKIKTLENKFFINNYFQILYILISTNHVLGKFLISNEESNTVQMQTSMS